LRNKDTKYASSVQEAMASYFGRKGIKKRIAQAAVVNDWDQLVGPQIAKITEPVSMDGAGNLWVKVSSPSWLQELQLMSPTIIHTLAKRGKRIKRIRWIMGEPKDNG